MKLQWFVQPAILMPNKRYPEEVLKRGLMRPMSRTAWEAAEANKRRREWDEKHPRCETCGQFLAAGMSHYVQDYWGEWDHI